MSRWRELKRKAGFIKRRNTFDENLDQEIRFHLESRADELMAGGLSMRDARAQAQREFGRKMKVHEQSRAEWQFQWFADMAADLSYATRALRNPGFALAAVLSLALGIGANTTIFSLTMEFLFSAPSCRDAASLQCM